MSGFFGKNAVGERVNSDDLRTPARVCDVSNVLVLELVLRDMDKSPLYEI
jgi:hypothetical protein